MKRYIFYMAILTVFICGACGLSKKQDIQQMVYDWRGREIFIPFDVQFKTLGRDTLCTDLWDKPYKIFTYIDSIGCSSCQLGLHEWKEFIDSCQREQMDIGFIFAVHSSDYRLFDGEVRFYEFDYPIIYDYHNEFDRLNHFPPAPYRTFLLDRGNKVQVIGSPVNNPEMWELYQKVMSSRN